MEKSFCIWRFDNFSLFGKNQFIKVEGNEISPKVNQSKHFSLFDMFFSLLFTLIKINQFNKRF